MPYYLTQFIDNGPYKGGLGRKCLAVGQDQPGSAIIDLRADGGASVGGAGMNACLLYVPVDFIDPRALKVADLPGETVSLAQRTLLAARLGKSSLTQTVLVDIIGEIMTESPAGGWRPIKAEALGTRLAAYLGPLTWSQPAIVGGNDGHLINLYERLQACGGAIPRPLARASFRRPVRGRVWRWLKPLLNLHGIGAVLATDNFNRADNGDLGTAWDVMTGESSWKILSNAATPGFLSSDCGENYNGVTWPDDQYSQLTLPTVTGGTDSADDGGGVGLRMSTSVRTYYRIIMNAATTTGCGISKQVAGVYTNLGFRDSDAVANDVAYAEIQGTTLIVKKNGVQLGASFTDSSIASGRAGIFYSSTITALTGDDWEGGVFGVSRSIILSPRRPRAFAPGLAR